MQFIVYYCSTVFKNGSRDPGRRGTTTRMFGCPNFLVVLFVLFVEMYILYVEQRKEQSATSVATLFLLVVRSRQRRKDVAYSRFCAYSTTLLSMKVFASSLKFSNSFMWTVLDSSPSDLGIFHVCPSINGRLWRRPGLANAITAAITTKTSDFIVARKVMEFLKLSLFLSTDE